MEAAYKGPLVVLINRLSASASEIFAGAIQDYGRGVIVGNRTFGKGTVQHLQPASQGQLKLTQAKFYRVSGASTQHRGVVPDVELPSGLDFAEIGESALPDALPWDEITEVEYDTRPELARIKQSILAHHRERMANDPGLIALERTAEYSLDLRRDTTVSLNEQERRREREERKEQLLSIENEKRKALGLGPIDDLDDLPDEPSEDAELLEAARILTDLVVCEASRIHEPD